MAQQTPLVSSPPLCSSPPQETPALVASPASFALLPAPVETQLPILEPFSGELDKCAGFLTQCSLLFCQQQRIYEDDGAKIAYFVQLLYNCAVKWAQAALKANPKITYSEFLSEFKTVFNKGSSMAAAAHRLVHLKQGKRSMSDYSVDFWILAEETGRGQEALKSTLLNNVCEELKNELIMQELPSSLDALVSLCIQVDDHLQARWSVQNFSSQTFGSIRTIFWRKVSEGQALCLPPHRPYDCAIDLLFGDHFHLPIYTVSLSQTEKPWRLI